MSGITDSQFYMWRTLFALAHADNVITKEEIRFMAEALEDVPFSDAQKAVLTEDIKHPADIIEMFKGISDVKDQARFFKFAHDLVWADGDYGQAEQEIMLKLMKKHVGGGKVDELIGTIELELEEAPKKQAENKREPKTIITAFRQIFSRGGD